jgi:hypothetical protein
MVNMPMFASGRRQGSCLPHRCSVCRDRQPIATIGMAPWPGFFKWMNWQCFESFGMADVMAYARASVGCL